MTMQYFLTTLAIIVVCMITYAIIEFLVIKYNGIPVDAPDIPRSSHILGTGPKLTYVVMGDSTSIGQGTEYEHSYAIASARHLAKNHEVTLINTGISGAKLHDLLDNQLNQAMRYNPDVVLLGVGANDTTHFTNLKHLQNSLQKIITGLRQANPDVRIVATRSPAMDSVSRFPLITKYILRVRTNQVNNALDFIIKKNGIEPAYIAEKTRMKFLADPSLTSADNFHPNARGYALWIPLINDSLDAALSK